MPQQNKLNRSKIIKQLAQDISAAPAENNVVSAGFTEKMDGQEIVFQKLGSYWYAFTEQNGDPFFARIEPGKLA